MSTSRSLDELAVHVQRVLEILAEGRTSLSTSEATQWQALALARWQLQRALSGFVELTGTRWVDLIASSGDEVAASEAEDLGQRNEQLRQAYGCFVDRWALQSPSSVDEEYLAKAGKIADRIERTVIACVQDLERLIGHIGR